MKRRWFSLARRKHWKNVNAVIDPVCISERARITNRPIWIYFLEIKYFAMRKFKGIMKA